MSDSSGILFSKEHEWVSVEGGVAAVGITAYAQSQLGDLVFIELPEVGASVSQHGDCGVLESVKAVGTLFSPISGEVVEVNGAAVDDPGIVANDADGTWLIKVRMSNAADLEDLMNAEQYAAYTAGG